MVSNIITEKQGKNKAEWAKRGFDDGQKKCE